jgi:tape measure domain-containing protein
LSDVTRRARYILSAEDHTKAALNSFNKGLGSANDLLRTFGVGLSAAGFLAFTKQIADASLQIDRLNSRFAAATGSFEAGRRELEFVRATAGRLGLDLLSAADSYSSLTAAASGTTLAGQSVRDIFESVAQTSAVLGLSSEQTQGALLALEQMMSKGTVQAEELRGQLGERIPGAFRIAAEAMGVSTSELSKMLEQGEVVASDFLPKFAVALRNNYQGEIPEHTKALNNLKTEFFEFTATLGKAGVQDTVVWGISTATEALATMRGGVNDLAFAFQNFPEDSAFARSIDFVARGSAQIMEFARMVFGAHINDPDLAGQQIPGLPSYLLRERSLGGADNLDPTTDLLPFALAPSAAIAGAGDAPLGKKTKAGKVDKSLLPFEEPLTTLGQAGGWESIAQAQITAQNASLQAQIEFDEQRYAGAIDAGNQMRDLFLLQAEEKVAVHQRGLDAELWAEQQMAQQKALLWQGSASTFLTIGANLQAMSAGQSRKMFEVAKAASIAGTIIETYKGAQGAFSAYSMIPIYGPILGAAAAAAAIVAGKARVKAIQSTQFGGGGGAVVAGSSSAFGNFSGSGPPTTVEQPTGTAKQAQQVTIVLNNAIGSREWFEDNLPSVMKELTGRNVDMGLEVRSN